LDRATSPLGPLAIVRDLIEFYLRALIVLVGGTLLSAAVGTGVVLGACFIIAHYIKMTVKELPSHLAERTNEINHFRY
jgi:hypothetical protein